MRTIAGLSTLLLLFIMITAFVPRKSETYAETSLCETVKKIATAFSEEKFDLVRGSSRGMESGEEQFVSTVTIAGFKEQFIYQNEDEIYFEAKLDKKFSNGDNLRKALKNIAAQLEKCLGVKPEYLPTENYIFYTFMIGDIEVELSGDYPDKDKRFINLEINLPLD